MDEFDSLDSIAPPLEELWPAIKDRFPLATKAAGVVVARQPFGVFLDLGCTSAVSPDRLPDGSAPDG